MTSQGTPSRLRRAPGLWGLVLFGITFVGPTGTSARAQSVERFQLSGEWCFVKAPAGVVEKAVIAIHGNGEVVTANGSSWEEGAGENSLMNAFVSAGYLVAQSNAGAVPGNGMWGNPTTQTSVVALIEHLRRRGVRQFNAVAASAGNLTLLNLILGRKVTFDSVILVAPVVSLASMYRCPAGIDRVSQISTAFAFVPAAGCPGDALHDKGFVSATAGFDPAVLVFQAAGWPAIGRKTRWMAVYEEFDARVPPRENIAVLQPVLTRAGIPMKKAVLPGAVTHGSRELFDHFAADIVAFVQQR